MDNKNWNANICKDFLKASQRGDLKKLIKLASEHDVEDWTVYRHEVSGDTPLHLAAREGNYEVTKFLCEHWDQPCFKPEVTNKDMKRPIHEAAQFAKINVLEYLLELGAAVDPLKRADWTPLMLACTKNGQEATQCVDILLKHGAVSGFRNKDGWTPLMIACRAGNMDAVKSLIKHSSDRSIIYTKSKNGRSLLHVADENLKVDRTGFELIDLKLFHNFSVYKAFHGHRDIIDILLSEDKSLINCEDSSGSTPLLESVKSRDLATLEHLIEAGADFKAVDNAGQSILHLAAQSGNIDMIKFIIKYNLVDVDSRASLGITPLMLAEKNKQLEAVQILSSFK